MRLMFRVGRPPFMGRVYEWLDMDVPDLGIGSEGDIEAALGALSTGSPTWSALKESNADVGS